MDHIIYFVCSRSSNKATKSYNTKCDEIQHLCTSCCLHADVIKYQIRSQFDEILDPLKSNRRGIRKLLHELLDFCSHR